MYPLQRSRLKEISFLLTFYLRCYMNMDPELSMLWLWMWMCLQYIHVCDFPPQENPPEEDSIVVDKILGSRIRKPDPDVCQCLLTWFGVKQKSLRLNINGNGNNIKHHCSSTYSSLFYNNNSNSNNSNNSNNNKNNNKISILWIFHTLSYTANF